MLTDADRAVRAMAGSIAMLAGLAVVMFIGLFGFGSSYFGWQDPHGRVSLALFAAFVFGIICGFRVKD